LLIEQGTLAGRMDWVVWGDLEKRLLSNSALKVRAAILQALPLLNVQIFGCVQI
jgi:hypothetical protein